MAATTQLPKEIMCVGKLLGVSWRHLKISQRNLDKKRKKILAYMESRRQAVCDIIEVGLSVLPEKIQNARSAAEVTTALGTLIDKFTAFGGGPGNDAKEDGLSQSLREMAKELESDD